MINTSFDSPSLPSVSPVVLSIPPVLPGRSVSQASDEAFPAMNPRHTQFSPLEYSLLDEDQDKTEG